MIHARGELEAAESLGQAAIQLEAHPAALQLRTLSTLAEIALEKNSTIVFPLPFDIMRVVEGIGRQLQQSSAAIVDGAAGNGQTTTTGPPERENSTVTG